MRTSARPCARATDAIRARRWLWVGASLAALCVFLLATAGAEATPPDGYTQVTVTYSTAGCSIWQVPGELAGSVSVTAVGAAGAAGVGGGSGGAGDEVSGTLTGFESPSQSLWVCVDQGGGSPGDGAFAGGFGGGASGVSYGTDFSEPFIVAGGGGGGGGGTDGATGGGVGYDGSNVAGAPTFETYVYGRGGDGATDSQPGAGGPGAGFPFDYAGNAGAEFTSSGPGVGGFGGGYGRGGGAGGGGGGGYYGGGGGAGGSTGGGGGGGGSDFCSSEFDYGVDVSTGGSCSTTAGVGTGTSAGTAANDAHVTLSYLEFTGFTTTTSSQPYSAATNAPWAGAGNTAYDTASVAGAIHGFTPSGTLTYSLYGNGTCNGTATTTQTVTLNGDGSVPNSSSTGPLAPGTYSFLANYNGDSYFVSSSDCESFTVVRVPTKLMAWPQLVEFQPFAGVGSQVVAATLTAGGSPVSGEPIYFSAGSTALCHANTNASGFARCTISGFEQSLLERTNRYSASFAGDGSYAGSSATTGVVVLSLF